MYHCPCPLHYMDMIGRPARTANTHPFKGAGVGVSRHIHKWLSNPPMEPTTFAAKAAVGMHRSLAD